MEVETLITAGLFDRAAPGPDAAVVVQLLVPDPNDECVRVVLHMATPKVVVSWFLVQDRAIGPRPGN
jgi:hypothetical protein